MKRFRTISLAILTMALAAGAYWLVQKDKFKSPLPQGTAAEPVSPGRALLFAGSSSCAGRSCHGGLAASDHHACGLNEFTLWIANDPHAQAYQVLKEKPALDMAAKLGLAVAPHASPQCLGCHTFPGAALPSTDPTQRELINRERALGVGCESCHGNAARWVDEHLASSWKALTRDEKSKRFGMNPVGEPAALAKTCAGCHVGAPAEAGIPARDVNHDLIAAGHPRLAFELSSYLANMPSHWNPRPEKPAEMWLAGQFASAQAALGLLRHRASSPEAPWPEFAELDCYACHHRLTEPSWRQSGKSRPGRMTWGSWYFSLTKALADEATPRRPLSALDTLSNMMETNFPSRAAVLGQLDTSLDEVHGLEKALQPLSGTPQFANDQMRKLLLSKSLRQQANWDAAEQLFLALFAFNETAKNPALQKKLGALLEERAFPRAWNGPGPGFHPPTFFEKLGRYSP